MPLQFAAPGSLGRGRKPQPVPPPSGAQVSPIANEGAGLIAHQHDNLHLQGTPARPGFSAQVQPLNRAIDPADLEAAGAVGDPTKLGPMATKAEVRTQTMDHPALAQQRLNQMDTNRMAQQQQTQLTADLPLVREVVPAQQVQKAMGQQRVAGQLQAQAGGRDQTGAVADAQAWSAQYRLERMDPRQLGAIDNLAARMGSGGNAFAIGA